MPGMGMGLRLGLARAGGGAAFDIARFLQSLGVPSVYFDPSDHSTLFQDSAGTTPANQPGHIVRRMLSKGFGDNHATQADADKAPALARMPAVGIRNIMSDSTVNKAVVGVVGSGGVIPFNVNPGLDQTKGLSREIVNIGDDFFDYRIFGTTTSSGSLFISFSNLIAGFVGAPHALSIDVQLIAGSFGALVPHLSSSNGGGITPMDFGQTRQVHLSPGAAGGTIMALRINNLPDATAVDFTLRIARPQFEAGTADTLYQRVTTALDVTEAGVRDIWYLQPDGVDDFMQVSAFNLSGIGDVSFMGGFEVLSNEGHMFSFNSGISQPSWRLWRASGDIYRVGLRSATGTVASRSSGVIANNQRSVFDGAVRAGTVDMRVRLNINGTDKIAYSTDSIGGDGPINYGSHTLHLFSRNNSSDFVTCRFFGGVVAGIDLPLDKRLLIRQALAHKAGVSL